MKRFKYKKRFHFKQTHTILIILIAIFLNTLFFINFFLNKLSDVIVITAKKELNEITVNLVTSNFTKEKLKEITMEELIITNKNKDDEIIDIDFKLDRAYEVLIDIKSNLEKDMKALKSGKVPDNTIALGNNLIIKVPYYTYTNNALLMNLGPKIYVKVNMLENVIGDVYTKITSYGINTVLINLYIKLYLTESLMFPTKSEKTEYEFELLVSSKVIQGKIPSLYNGLMESNSSIINPK